MAVYTQVGDDDLSAFLKDYALGAPLSLKGIAEGVENSNFLLATETGTYILTLYEKRVKAEDLPFFLNLLQHLAAQGLECPVPVAARDGAALRTLCGHHAVIVSFLTGIAPRKITSAHCAALGEALGRLHLAGRDFPMNRANNLSVAGWRPLWQACAPRADTVHAKLATVIPAELDALEQNWPQNLPTGIIHADLFPDNVFFKGNQLSGLIDFYFACTDQLIYDVAICMNAWCFEPDGLFNVTKAQNLLTHYHRVRPCSAAEIAALPLLARGSALRFLLTRLYDGLNRSPGALVQPKDPLEYWRKLLFHQDVQSAAAYGLSL